MQRKIIIVSGYFNPFHVGHLEYFNKAKMCGDVLFVIVNNDHQRSIKGSKDFMNEKERLAIIESLRVVDYAMISIDKDRTVRESVRKVYNIYSTLWKNNYTLAFANGGDQNNNSIPERDICLELGIELIDGLGEKIQSSSWLLKSS